MNSYQYFLFGTPLKLVMGPFAFLLLITMYVVFYMFCIFFSPGFDISELFKYSLDCFIPFLPVDISPFLC